VLSLGLDRHSAAALGFPRDLRLRLDVDDAGRTDPLGHGSAWARIDRGGCAHRGGCGAWAGSGLAVVSAPALN
jgi:hypothetical protein